MLQSEGLGRKLSRPTQLGLPTDRTKGHRVCHACGQDLALAITCFASSGVMTPAQTANASKTKSVNRACLPGANNCESSTTPEKTTSSTIKRRGLRW